MRPPFFPKKISIAKPLKIKVFAPCHNRVFGEEECDRLVDLWERYMPSSAPNARVLRFEDFELDVRAGELRKHGVRLRLQGQPLQVLAALLNGSGDVLTREELQRQIWAADTFVDFGHSLHNAIARLREVLGDSAETPRYIETLPRRGYRFIAPVETLEVVSPSRAAHPEDPRPTSAESKQPTISRNGGWSQKTRRLTDSAYIAHRPRKGSCPSLRIFASTRCTAVKPDWSGRDRQNSLGHCRSVGDRAPLYRGSSICWTRVHLACGFGRDRGREIAGHPTSFTPHCPTIARRLPARCGVISLSFG